MTILTGTYIATVTLAGVVDGFVAYDADAVTLFAAMTTPPTVSRKGHINTMIVDLKAAGIWDGLDELWVMAAHNAQAGLLGWKRYKDLTAVNAPTFETDRGYAGNGTTSYLSTNFVPSTDGVQFVLNDASLGVYSRTNNFTNSIDMGAWDAFNNRMTFARLRSNALAFDGVVSTNTETGKILVSSADSLGLFVARRSAAGAVQGYKNGTEVATGTSVSSSLTQFALFIGALNGGGSATSLVARQYAAAFVGASLSAGQQASFATILETFLDAIGAGVVS